MECSGRRLKKAARKNINRTTKKLFFALVFTVTGCLAFFSPGLAEEGQEDTKGLKLEPMVVTANKLATDVYKMPTNTSIITREDIEKYGARDITDLLKQVPGLKITGLGYGSPSIGFYGTRGSEPDIRGVKIMVNGIDWSKGSGMFSPPRVPINDIERIEIIKTPSAIYGDQGSGGVINIITRVSKKPIEAKAGMAYGSYGAEKYFSVLNGTNNNVEYFIDASLTKTDGYQDNAYSKYTNISSRIKYWIDEVSSLTFNGLVLDLSLNFPSALNLDQFNADPRQSPPARGETESESWIAALEYDTVLGPLALKAKLAVNGDDSGGFGRTYTIYDEFAIWPELTLSWTQDLGNMKNKMVGGVEYRNYTMDTLKYSHTDGALEALTSDRQREDDVWGAYLQDELQLTEDFTVTAGIRFDSYKLTSEDSVDSTGNFESSDNAWSPKIGASYRFSDAVNLFAGLNSGFRSVVRGVTTSAINSSLKPERVYSYEVGLRGAPLPWLTYNTAIFQTDWKDKIIRIADDPATYDNAGESRARGVEAGINVNLENGIYGALNYTYQDSEYIEYRVGSTSYNGNRLPRVSEHLFGGSIGYRHDHYGDLCFYANYTGDKYLDSANTFEWPDYWIYNAKYTKRLVSEKPQLEFYISAENLTDEQYVEVGYSESSLYPSYGRLVMAGMNVFF